MADFEIPLNERHERYGDGSGYAQWCREQSQKYGVEVIHAHCLEGCESPQPFVDNSNTLICGVCYAFRDKRRTPMDPCIPSDCEGA